MRPPDVSGNSGPPYFKGELQAMPDVWISADLVEDPMLLASDEDEDEEDWDEDFDDDWDDEDDEDWDDDWDEEEEDEEEEDEY